MGVDANELVGYGIFVTGRLFHYEDVEDGDKPFTWNSEEKELNYNYDITDEKDYMIVTEPYGGDWTFIGINFLSRDVDKTIENLKQVKEKWNNLITELLSVIPEEEKELREKITKEEPQIVEEAYYS